jgi:4-hydroxy-4-methyl-2-oxoglutarate aldolase
MATSSTAAMEVIKYLQTTPSGFVTDGKKRIGISGSMFGLQSAIRFNGRSLAGPALTMKFAPVRGTKKSSENFYSILRTAKPGDVLVAECRLPDYFFLGENIVHHAIRCGAVGIVLDGGARDIAEIRELDFPLFSTGPALRSFGSVLELVDFNVPIVCAGAQVEPGDILHGDEDGVNVIPLEALDKIMESVKHVAAVEAEQAEAIHNDVPLEELFRVMAKKR